MKNLYLYFSGTGNTKYVIEKFSSLYENSDDFTIQSIEHKNIDYEKKIRQAELIIIAYPIYDSMIPFIMKEFLEKYIEAFRNKNIITLATQLLFSGDGGALASRLLKKVNTNLLHSIHVNMPSNLVDVKFFKNIPLSEADAKVKKADQKIERTVLKIKSGKTIRDGRKFYSWFLGFFTQRVWGILFLKPLRGKIKINHAKCIQCGICVNICPMDNLRLENGKIEQNKICTWCYRCINSCPEKAITLFTKQTPKVQYIRKDYN
jgi:ferredoxin/flavodoxin